MIGLPPFLEPGASPLRGRDADRDALLRMLSKQWVRAGLLVGDIGVGRSALLRRGVVPHLRAEGGVVLVCEDPMHPTRSFAEAAALAGYSARPGESHLDLLTRAVETATGSALWTLLLDDLDLALATPAVVQEVADLLAHVCPRPGGRARFLFSAAGTRLLACDPLERITGPLFPVTCRYLLPRLEPPIASELLADALSAEGVECESDVVRSVIAHLAARGGILPADLRVAARAMRKLGVRTEVDLSLAGGPGDLARRWIVGTADATGDRPAALRVLGEMAGLGPLQLEEAARRAGVGNGFAGLVEQCGIEWGVCARVGSGSQVFALAHEALVEPVRAVAAPELERSGRARRALQEAAARAGRLSLAAYWDVQRSHVAPASPGEEAALRATARLGRVGALAALAVPLVLLISAYVLTWGRYHLASETRPDGDRIFVRAGRPALKALFWLPHRPALGSVVADPGIARWMVARKAWAAANGAGGSLGDAAGARPEYLARSLALLRPPLRGAILYALDDSGEAALAGLERTLQFPEEWTEAISLLEPLARGGADETRFILSAIADRRHEIRAAALAAVARVERRRPGLYADVLAAALASSDPAVARRAHTLLQDIPNSSRAAIAARAVVRARDGKAKEALLGDVGQPTRLEPRLAAEVAGAVLSDESPPSRRAADLAWALLDHALATDEAAALTAIGAVIASERTAEAIRLRALDLLDGRAFGSAPATLGPALAAAVDAKSPALRAAALPLCARLFPDKVRARLTETGKAELRAAQALAWGELAASDPAAARGALDGLLADSNAMVRAAAARAYGHLGRAAQEKLLELVKDLGVVGEGAAFGLAASVHTDGSLDAALLGIGRLWGKKGGPKRSAAQVYAQLAESRPAAALPYLAAAARDATDAQLRRIGVDGLCRVFAAGKEKGVGALLAAVAAGPHDEARAGVAACLAAHRAPADAVLRVTDRLGEDSAEETRRLAVVALAPLAAAGVPAGRSAREFVEQMADFASDRSSVVRAEALAALAAPPVRAFAGDRALARALREAWGRASGEADQLRVLDAAMALNEASVFERGCEAGSARVRQRSIEGIAATAGDLRLAVERGLNDVDVGARRAAMRALAAAGDRVPRADAVELLEIALSDAELAGEALMLYAQLEYPTRALARLESTLAAPSERDRAAGARAAGVLVLREVAGARRLLDAALVDPARDVRAAAVEALAEVEAQVRSPEALGAALADSERDALRRLATTRALLIVAKGRKAEAVAALEKVAKDGPPLGRLSAEIALGLLRHDTDGFAFLAALVP